MTVDPAGTNCESPSLGSPGEGTAYELKFLVTDANAQEIEAWAQRSLMLDPYGDPAWGGAYHITSLYCDTPQLDVYFGSSSYKRRKFRVRRYGMSPTAFLERKSKRGDRVRKRRSTVPHDDVAGLVHPMSLQNWPGHWFHHLVHHRRLGPACRISYERTAYIGSCLEGPLRLTLDRRIRGVMTTEWTASPFDGGLPLLTGQVVVELKFRGGMPLLFKRLVQEMHLSPTKVSKYRLCREACGVPVLQQEAAHG